MTKRTCRGISLLEGLFALALLGLLLVPITTMMVGENEESTETVRFMQLLDGVYREKAQDPAAESWAVTDEDKVRELVLRRPASGTVASPAPGTTGGSP